MDKHFKIISVYQPVILYLTLSYAFDVTFWNALTMIIPPIYIYAVDSTEIDWYQIDIYTAIIRVIGFMRIIFSLIKMLWCNWTFGVIIQIMKLTFK